MDLRYIDAHQVLRWYLHERRRREEPPSLLAQDPDMPRAPSPVPPSGRYEQLLRLVVGVPEDAVRALFMLEFGWVGHQTAAQRYESLDGATSDAPATIPVVYESVAIAPTFAMVARQIGVSRREVEGLIRDAYMTVAENLGRARAEGRRTA